MSDPEKSAMDEQIEIMVLEGDAWGVWRVVQDLESQIVSLARERDRCDARVAELEGDLGKARLRGIEAGNEAVRREVERWGKRFEEKCEGLDAYKRKVRESVDRIDKLSAHPSGKDAMSALRAELDAIDMDGEP